MYVYTRNFSDFLEESVQFASLLAAGQNYVLRSDSLHQFIPPICSSVPADRAIAFASALIVEGGDPDFFKL